MALQRSLAGALLFAAMVLVASPRANGIEISISPTAPMDEQTFDLRAFREFDDTGYRSIDQSIAVDGNQINVRALIQDQHTQPGAVFSDVITSRGAFFDNYGPLAAGTYTVNAEIWYTFWPSTSYDALAASESSQFTIAAGGAIPEPTSLFLAMAALAAYLQNSRRR